MATAPDIFITLWANGYIVELETSVHNKDIYIFKWVSSDLKNIMDFVVGDEPWKLKIPFDQLETNKIYDCSVDIFHRIVQKGISKKSAAVDFKIKGMYEDGCSISPLTQKEGDPFILELPQSDLRSLDNDINQYYDFLNPAINLVCDVDHIVWETDNDATDHVQFNKKKTLEWTWDSEGLTPGRNYSAVVNIFNVNDGILIGTGKTPLVPITAREIRKDDIVPVAMQLTSARHTPDLALSTVIRNRADAISFSRYIDFIEKVFCDPWKYVHNPNDPANDLAGKYKGSFGNDPFPLETRISIHAVDAYNVLRLATEVFLLLQSGIIRKVNNKVTLITPDLFDPNADFFDPDEEGYRRKLGRAATIEDVENDLRKYLNSGDKLPYLKRIIKALLDTDPDNVDKLLPYCNAVLRYRYSCPSMIELIWSYWLEEGMLVQTMNTIALRFQNKKGTKNKDPLAELELDPLRPLNNLLWGYVQNGYNRLTAQRRAYEYDHEYGLTLVGKAVPRLRSADSRSKFIEAFHNLLNKTWIFYKDDADTTIVSDAYPLLQAIREVHLILAEGAHNQFGDLPWTARVEMMVEQCLLARPEIRDFLRGRAMVPYREEWMGQVDSMKKFQGWNDVTISHFHDLATFGEQLLLSIRYGDWINVNDENQSKNWARYWKPEIQGYIHAYRAVTGVDLSREPVDSTPPWVHLKRQEEKRTAAG